MKVTLYVTPQCAFGKAFLENFNEAKADLDFDLEVETFDPIEAYNKGIRCCPSMIINGEIITCGTLTSPEEMKDLLKKEHKKLK